ncbi:MAG TPA: CpsD/CapB family tyrosine-protein kinase [Steroidobacteraceae bacterium]|nr:CpsD/CapB family tyrosine-protein kinase [Steroidobacteraceae bacterium]
MSDSVIRKRELAIAAARLAAESAAKVGDSIAQLTRIREVDPALLERERILPAGAGGEHGRAYKMLRTQVMRRLDELGANSLAVIGSAPNTGKTLTAINLAIAIAADLDRTALLVDLDLRKPSVHRRLGFDVRTGIDDCLRRGLPLKDAMVRLVGYERLVLLPARDRCEDSSELLASVRTQECIREMRLRYKDRVLIFDLPPVLHSDDALAFSRHVQAALLVVSEGRTQRADVARSIELLHKVPIVGTVLNGTREKLSSYY